MIPGAWPAWRRAREADGLRRPELPPGAECRPDQAYGEAPAMRYDVYRPARAAASCPVLAVVHGGGWQRGDKAQAAALQHKLTHWLERGFVVLSINYRLLPEADPLQQADDVARALAHAQAHAGDWGGDPERFVLLGHSAGAHLVLLLASDASCTLRHGLRGWRGSVALDCAALDLVELMRAPHLPLYDAAFGDDELFWREASPLHRLQGRLAAPVLLVCSARRPLAWRQAEAFAAKARGAGGTLQLERVDLGHAEINRLLGLPGAYTDVVDSFFASLGVGGASG
ncbi:esterase [Rubrivivax gelatinosus]|nr:esterase [Rubrivivax gelatinosus]